MPWEKNISKKLISLFDCIILGAAAVPDLTAAPWSDDGGPVLLRQVQCLEGAAQSPGEAGGSGRSRTCHWPQIYFQGKIKCYLWERLAHFRKTENPHFGHQCFLLRPTKIKCYRAKKSHSFLKKKMHEFNKNFRTSHGWPAKQRGRHT